MRADVKEEELRIIFNEIDPSFSSDPVKVFVVGCGERRLVGHHKRIFENLTGKSVDQITSDIVIDHLVGEEGVIQHDGKHPLPDGPYDIIYAHVFLKFIDPDLQYQVVQNSYDALVDGGIAIHIFDREEIDSKNKVISDGSYSVALNDIQNTLTEKGIEHLVIEWTISDILPKPLPGLALVLKK